MPACSHFLFRTSFIHAGHCTQGHASPLFTPRKSRKTLIPGYFCLSPQTRIAMDFLRESASAQTLLTPRAGLQEPIWSIFLATQGKIKPPRFTSKNQIIPSVSEYLSNPRIGRQTSIQRFLLSEIPQNLKNTPLIALSGVPLRQPIVEASLTRNYRTQKRTYCFTWNSTSSYRRVELAPAASAIRRKRHSPRSQSQLTFY